MKNNIFSKVKLFSAMALVTSVLLFSGCQGTVETETEYYYVLPLDDDDSLIGTWVSTYDEEFVIDGADQTLTNNYSGSIVYAGESLVVLKNSDTEGYIYIKYTENAYDSSVAGKWYAISYKNLGDSSISIAGAYKEGGKSATDTLEEAVKEFTIDNGYFGTYSECTRQTSEK